MVCCCPHSQTANMQHMSLDLSRSDLAGITRDVDKTLSHKTETVNLQDRDETETFHFFNLQDRDEVRRCKKTSRDRDVQKTVSRPQCRSLKHQLVKSSHLTTCFLRVISIIFFVIYSHCMHDHKTSHETETLYLQDRDETETFDFSKLSRPRQDRDVQPSRPRRDEPFRKTSRDCLETETFKTETTSLGITYNEVARNL